MYVITFESYLTFLHGSVNETDLFCWGDFGVHGPFLVSYNFWQWFSLFMLALERLQYIVVVYGVYFPSSYLRVGTWREMTVMQLFSGPFDTCFWAPGTPRCWQSSVSWTCRGILCSAMTLDSVYSTWIVVWRRPGERFGDCFTDRVTSFGGGDVLVWGGISFSTHYWDSCLLNKYI